MTQSKLPTLFISHGGGPWPFMEDMKQAYAITAKALKLFPASLPCQPKAILSISGHWEENEFTVASSSHPPMIYDYSGFPQHTYSVKYPAPGSPQIAARVRELLDQAGIKNKENSSRGFDHGTFVPLVLMYPQADIPVVSLSLKSGYDSREHIQLGEALRPLREEGVLIVGSGLTYHNMRMFRHPDAGPVSDEFESWLSKTVSEPDAAIRKQKLLDWEKAPAARSAHPREDHLIPLMAAAGAAGNSVGKKLFVDRVWGIVMVSYQFGE